MTYRLLTYWLLFIAFLAVTANAQTAPELVAKAMAAENNKRDLDGALRLYRTVLTAPANDKVYAAYAQYRISQILLQKGELAAATQESQVFAQLYSDYNDLVRTLLSEERVDIFHSGSQMPQRMGIGRIEDGRYHHNGTGVELALQGWEVVAQVPSSGHGEMVTLRDPGSKQTASVWMIHDLNAAEDLPGLLRGGVQQKKLQRLQFQDYKMRPGSIQMQSIGGKNALSALADFVQNGTPMTECFTWIYTGNTRVQFFSRVPTFELPSLQPHFDQLVASAIVP